MYMSDSGVTDSKTEVEVENNWQNLSFFSLVIQHKKAIIKLTNNINDTLKVIMNNTITEK